MNLVQGEAPADALGTFVNLTSDRPYVYFNGDALYRVPMAGGAIETVFAGPFAGQFASGGGTLAYATVTKRQTGRDAWVYDATGLVLKDATGAEQTIPLDPGQTFVGPLLATPSGDVLFATGPSDQSTSAAQRWSPKTHTTTPMGVPLADWYDRGDVFYWDKTAAGAIALFAIDAAATTKPRKIVDGQVAVLGFDAANVYFGEPLCPAGNIDGPCRFRVRGAPRDGASPASIAWESPQAYSAAWMFADDSGVYWADWQSHDSAPIYRAKLTPGAAVEKIADTHATTYAVDACNVYWLEDAAHLMAVAK